MTILGVGLTLSQARSTPEAGAPPPPPSPLAAYDYYYPDYDQQLDISAEVVLINTTFVVSCPDTEHKADTIVFHNTKPVDINGGVEKITRLSEGSGSGGEFRVSDAQLTDSGRWTCRTVEGLLSEVNIIVADLDRLSVLVGGELTINSSDITLRSDSNVDLTCVLATTRPGELEPSLIWETGPDQPLTQPTHTYHSRQEGFSYTLVRVSSHLLLASSVGQVSCRQPDGGDNHQITLTIIEEFPPEFTISRRPEFGVPIVEDMTVSLRCTIESNPVSSPVWEHNGSPVTAAVAAGSSQRVSHAAGENFVEVTFDRISSEDEGWYLCATQHKFGNYTSVGYFLGVKPRPRVTEAGAPVTTSSILSDRVILVESGFGDSDGDGDLYGDEAIENCTRSRTAAAVGTVRDVRLPKLSALASTINVLEGDSFSLDIEVCSNPLPDRVIWSGPHLLLAAGSSAPRFEAAALIRAAQDGCQTGRLVGENARLEDTGIYIVIVRNDYHIVEERVMVKVDRAAAAADQARQAPVNTAAAASAAAGAKLGQQILPFMIAFILLVCRSTTPPPAASYSHL